MKFVQQEKPVTTEHKPLGKIEFAVEVPQAETVEEVLTMVGGNENLIAFFNGQVATNAKNTARAYARGYDVAEGTDPTTFPTIISSIVTKGQSLARDYSPATDTERGPSKAKKAAAFDNIAALVQSGKEFTKEELFALLQQAK
jgi:hypothetical protein